MSSVRSISNTAFVQVAVERRRTSRLQRSSQYLPTPRISSVHSQLSNLFMVYELTFARDRHAADGWYARVASAAVCGSTSGSPVISCTSPRVGECYVRPKQNHVRICRGTMVCSSTVRGYVHEQGRTSPICSNARYPWPHDCGLPAGWTPTHRSGYMNGHTPQTYEAM